MLKDLADRNGIIITKADKGGAVVIIDAEDCVKKQITTLLQSLNTLIKAST